jgi:Mn-dependent DtxR family transcriptional regulator
MSTPKYERPLRSRVPSPVEQTVLTFFKTYAKQNGKPPKMTEVADVLGVTKVTAHEHIRRLADKGFLDRRPNVSRGYTLTGRCPCCGCVPSKGGGR